MDSIHSCELPLVNRSNRRVASGQWHGPQEGTMRRLVGDMVAITLLTAAIVTFGAIEADADPNCDQTDPTSGQCLVEVTVPGNGATTGTSDNDDPHDSGSGQACFWDPKKQGLSGPSAGPVPCTSNMGYWSNAHNCYVKALEPQPVAGDPLWQGHDPSEGAVYSCFQPQTGIDIRLWSQDPPPGSRAGPTPREVAQTAVDQMNLQAIDIGIVPEPGAGNVGIVGMPVWMWVQDPTSRTYGPVTASASAGGITITATARVHKITWQMGDGTTVVCRNAGKPYKSSFGNQKSPDCGHTYLRSSANKPGGMFTVTATSDWIVTWAGAGQTGTIRMDGLTRTAAVTVGEAQVLVQ